MKYSLAWAALTALGIGPSPAAADAKYEHRARQRKLEAARQQARPSSRANKDDSKGSAPARTTDRNQDSRPNDSPPEKTFTSFFAPTIAKPSDPNSHGVGVGFALPTHESRFCFILPSPIIPIVGVRHSIPSHHLSEFQAQAPPHA